jgi:hypothetical protein
MDLTVTIPEALYKRAEWLAEVMKQPIDEVIAEALAAALPEIDAPIEHLTDAQVLALAESKMPAEQSERMSALSLKEKTSGLLAEERQELDALLNAYSLGQLRKSQAMVEAKYRFR